MTDIHTDTEAAARELATYRAARERAVRQPQGVLALVNTQWITGEPGVGQPVWGVPGIWAPRESDESGLVLTAELSDDIVVDGRVAQGQVVVRGHDDENPSEVRFSDTVTGYVIAGEDGGYALRVWDADSEAIRDFGGIDAFPYNPDWVVRASFTPLDEVKAVGFEHVKDDGRTRERVIPADITFEKDGVSYTLAAYWDEHKLLLVFGDATNGDSTYGVGRFLKVLPNDDGTITLDFNRAYLPPCAFSYHFNCPIPPKQNRFAVPIEAGEKNVLARTGGLLH